MDGDLQITLVSTDGHQILAVRGEIDMATAPQLEAAIARLGDVTDRAILDFSGVTFLDSSGIKVLISASQRPDAPSIVVRNASPQIVRTLGICGVADRFLESDPSRNGDQRPAAVDEDVGSSSMC